jgi:hypothetical protein
VQTKPTTGELSMTRKHALYATILVTLFATPALVDWDSMDPAKWVQLPDLNNTGIDVNASLSGTYDYILADGFRCVVSDTIGSIHIWG